MAVQHDSGATVTGK